MGGGGGDILLYLNLISAEWGGRLSFKWCK